MTEEGILTKTRCYLSGPMEYADGRGWRNKVKENLKPLGVVFFDPYEKPFATSLPEDEDTRKSLQARKDSGTEEDFDFLASYMRQVRSDDLRLCDIADFAIVHIIPAVASWALRKSLLR